MKKERKTCAQTRFTVFKMKTKQYEQLKKKSKNFHIYSWKINGEIKLHASCNFYYFTICKFKHS